MRVVGIICEYNPFHEGHAYLLEQAKKVTGADYAVCIMNGDFMQRGEPAVCNKYARTKAALAGGADMVFELPVRFGLSSAGDFAAGGILALQALGFVTDICFGSECGDLALLQKTADILFQETDSYSDSLKAALKSGQSYPAAQQAALNAISHCPENLLDKPNNVLGIQYCLALAKYSSGIIPHTIRRLGQGYHDDGSTDAAEYPSATARRKEIYESSEPHLTLNDFSDVIGYALREHENLSQYKDISPDLADRIKSLLDNYSTADTFVSQCQSKNYTAGRIRRSMLQCLLGLKETEDSMPYLRLLGMKKEAGALLQKETHPASFHILSRLAVDVKTLSPADAALFRQDLLAADLYRQIWCRKYNTTLPNEFQHSPVLSE